MGFISKIFRRGSASKKIFYIPIGRINDKAVENVKTKLASIN